MIGQIAFTLPYLLKYLSKINKNWQKYTVQAIRNITNFSCKKFIRIRTNFVLKFVHEIREKFVHEFVREFAHEFVHESICLKIAFLRKRYGEVSLILPEIFQCRVLSAWADTEIC